MLDVGRAGSLDWRLAAGGWRLATASSGSLVSLVERRCWRGRSATQVAVAELLNILIKNGAVTGPVCICMVHGLLRRLEDPGGSSERYLPTSVPGAGRCLGRKR